MSAEKSKPAESHGQRLRAAVAQLVIYSTPCLFAAQAAIEDAMLALEASDGSLAGGRIGVPGLHRDTVRESRAEPQ